MAILSMEKWDAGQAVVLPHSLKMVARAKLTLPKPSAGAADGGGKAETRVSSLSPYSSEPWRWEGREGSRLS